jgi:hypothetical protein
MNSKRALLSKTRADHRKGMFSACCLVSDWEQYEQHCHALTDKGFDEYVCEYLICDNTAKNEFDAFEAIRLFMASAKGEYVLIAHQDTAPLDKADKLISLIQELQTHDPSWGVIGNAGKAMDSPIDADMHIDMPRQSARITSPFIRVDSLDENILIVRNGTGITVSSNLRGFHFYGADICLIAERLGYSSYVAQFLWRHKSNGTLDKEFFKLKQTFEEHLHRHRVKTSLPTTCTVLCWSDSPRLRGKAAALAKSIRRENEDQLLSCSGSIFWSTLYTLSFFFCQVYYDLVSVARPAYSRVIGDVQWWRNNWKQRLLARDQKRPSDAEPS